MNTNPIPLKFVLLYFKKMELDRTVVEVETSFEDAERKTRQRYLKMTPEDRMQVVEDLRKLTYPNGVAPRLENVVECISRNDPAGVEDH